MTDTPEKVVILADRDPRNGPWHSAFSVCASCLYHWAAVWAEGVTVNCPECGSRRTVTWADAPEIEELLESIRQMRADYA